MAIWTSGRVPTAAELRSFTERLERQLLKQRREILEMTQDEKTDNAIRLLSMQQERMSEDIKDISKTLSKVADALSDLAVLEQKHTDSMDAIIRAHKRIDSLEVEWKGAYKDYSRETKKTEEGLNRRISDLEIHNAKNIWIERLFMAIAIAIATLWAKGAL